MMLALLASVVILIATTTGVVLAFDAVKRAAQAKTTSGWQDIRLAELLDRMDSLEQEVIGLEITPHGEMHLQTSDSDSGETEVTIVDPYTLDSLGMPLGRSAFVMSMQTLHRSLFLDEFGRIIVGASTFLFFLILLTGLALLLKRYGLRGYFSPTQETYRSGVWHVVLGRWLIVPLLLIALSASVLFLYQVGMIPQSDVHTLEHQVSWEGDKMLTPSHYPAIQDITLGQVRSFEYPLFEDEDEPYRLRLREKELIIHPFNGEVISELYYPASALIREWSLDIHTGRTSQLWAIVLGLSAVATIVFVMTGLMMMVRRLRLQRSNTSSGVPIDGAEYLLLVGSEHGTTLRLAEGVLEQWQMQGLSARLVLLNDCESLAGCRHLVVFSCTYGEGEPPANASQFLDKLPYLSSDTPIQYSVVAFGSERYPKFGAYGIAVDEALEQCPWAKRLVPIQLIHNRSAEQLLAWAHLWSEASGISLSDALEDYKLRRNK